MCCGCCGGCCLVKCCSKACCSPRSPVSKALNIITLVLWVVSSLGITALAVWTLLYSKEYLPSGLQLLLAALGAYLVVVAISGLVATVRSKKPCGMCCVPCHIFLLVILFLVTAAALVLGFIFIGKLHAGALEQQMNAFVDGFYDECCVTDEKYCTWIPDAAQEVCQNDSYGTEEAKRSAFVDAFREYLENHFTIILIVISAFATLQIIAVIIHWQRCCANQRMAYQRARYLEEQEERLQQRRGRKKRGRKPRRRAASHSDDEEEEDSSDDEGAERRHRRRRKLRSKRASAREVSIELT